MKYILASKSPRRQELLKMLNIDFEVIASTKEEIKDNKLSPIDNCINISKQKAIDIKNQTDGDRVIISCDTIVEKDNMLYGKPKNYNEAFKMLKLLNNTSHNVISCLTVIYVKDNQEKLYQTSGIGKVYIDNMSDFEIDHYIRTNEPYDKAGGYAIQEKFGKYITKIEGDYYSIVGLPLNKLYNILKELNVK